MRTDHANRDFTIYEIAVTFVVATVDRGTDPGDLMDLHEHAGERAPRSPDCAPHIAILINIGCDVVDNLTEADADTPIKVPEPRQASRCFVPF